MGFEGRAGTRGARQPGGLLIRLANRLVMGRIRRTGGDLDGRGRLVLTTVGAKSGLERQSPVAWFPDADGWLVVASAGGAPKNPAWYHNLAAHPDRVRIELSGRTVEVTADQLQGPQRAEAWSRIVAAAPGFAAYQEKTDREIPVIRLTPRP